MKLRKITSLTALLSFVLMLVTSIILYIVPQGRVAYWADWSLLGLDKTQWGDIHINMGLLFLLSIGLHIYYNWKTVLAYLKDKTRRLKIWTPEFNAALGLTAILLVGTLAAVPPFNWPLVFNTHLKDAAAAKYGEPPYGHAELSRLEDFARRTGLPLPAAVAALKEAGIRFDNTQATLQTIARQNGRSPQDIYRLMRPTGASAPTLPADPPPGTGKKTLAALCRDYSLPVAVVSRTLQGSGLQISPELTLKEIGAKNGVTTMDIYQAVRQAAAGHREAKP
ncbi:MAG: DUF4405 domain-containing protein [Desulfobacterales bacterium]